MKDLVGSLPVQRKELDNGMVLLVNERPYSELVAIAGSFLAGPVFDSSPGLAHFVANMMMRGTKTRTYLGLVDEVESLGAGMDFHAADDVSWVAARCTSRSLDKTMEIMMDCIMNPTFPEEEIEKVRGQMLTRIMQREDSTAAVARRVAREMLFPEGNPYHSDPLGYAESIQSIDRDDLIRFWEEHYGPQAMVISLSGNIRAAEAEEKVAPYIRGWESDQPPPEVPSIAVGRPVAPSRKVLPMMHKSQVDIVVMCQAIPRSHPDHYAFDQGNTILGRIGLMGRLGKSIRDRQGLAYYAASSYGPKIGGGYWMAYAGVNPANVDRALDGIRQEMVAISRQPVSKREASDVKTNKIGSLALRLESCGDAAEFMHQIELHRLGLDYVDRYEEIVRGVTRDDIQRVCSEYLRPDESVTAIVGPYEG